MLFTKFAITAVALLLPLSTSALSLARPMAGVLKDQSPISVMEGWSWVDCGLPGDAVQLKSIQVSPDPPQPGKDLTITVEGYVEHAIEASIAGDGAYADVTVKLGLIKLIQKQFDVCEEARAANASVQCPVSKGDYTVVQTVTLPREIPRAKFLVNVRAYTVDEDPMMCVDLKVDFMRDFPHLP